MRIAFRTDASLQMSTGHVMRCLTLADVLQAQGVQCTFICRQQPGNLLDFITQRGHKVITLPAGDKNQQALGPVHVSWLSTDWATDAEQSQRALGQESVDWLVVDHYALDRSWEQAMRPYCRKLMVIDDLADRPHDCDLLLDQNLGRTEQDYADLLQGSTQTLIGTKYALLRPEFARWREYSMARRQQPQLKNLLITMGGVDHGNATGQVLDALKTCELPTDLRITVVMGPHSSWLAQVQTQAAAMPWETQVLTGANNMGQIMADSDLAIGGAGSTAWERCTLGLPTLVMVLAENQKLGAQALQAAGAALMLKDINAIRDHLRSIVFLEDNQSVLLQMSKLAAHLSDGKGANRVVQKLQDKHV